MIAKAFIMHYAMQRMLTYLYSAPKELIPEILSDIESCLSDLQKSFREL